MTYIDLFMSVRVNYHNILFVIHCLFFYNFYDFALSSLHVQCFPLVDPNLIRNGHKL